MPQNYIDDCFSTTHVVITDMQAVENNFAALKSSFSGTSAPSNPIAGMWWFDTTANILKLRNEANNAWQSVWDFANNKPVIANLSDDITGAMIAAALKDPVAATAGLRTLGTGAQQAAAGNQQMVPTDLSVTTGKIVDLNVTGDKIANGTIPRSKLAYNAGEIRKVHEGGINYHYECLGADGAWRRCTPTWSE